MSVSTTPPCRSSVNGFSSSETPSFSTPSRERLLWVRVQGRIRCIHVRKETPEKYESYVDLVPGEWTRVKIEVRGAQAKLYVHDQSQPTLIVNDLKSGANGRGAIALWLDIGTEAHFRNLSVTREPSRLP